MIKDIGLISSFINQEMIYNNFGHSGLKISAISLGTANTTDPKELQNYQKIIELAYKKGINYFDTAQIYGGGVSQTLLGTCLKNLNIPRSQIVIGTKVLTAVKAERNSTMNTNRKHIKQSVKKSLARLQVDYVDILYAHIYDNETPLQEICRGFHEVIQEGLCFYWAVSNWQPQCVYNALTVCQKLNLHKPIGVQNNYNMFTRQINQIEYESLFKKYNLGLIAWSPLAGGILTGKYLKQNEEIGKARFKHLSPAHELYKKMFYNPYVTEKNNNALIKLEEVAKELGCKLVHLALAWVLKFQYTNSALIGARNTEQLQDCLLALEVAKKIETQTERKINDILDNTPETRMDYIKWSKLPSIRPVSIPSSR